MLFEKYADNGILTRRRFEDPFLGVFFFGPEFRFTEQCPWPYWRLLNDDPREVLRMIDEAAAQLAHDEGLY